MAIALSQEDRVRNPVKGLRAQLRTALRKLGVSGKLETAHHRRLGLLVRCDTLPSLPLTVFKGYRVNYTTQN